MRVLLVIETWGLAGGSERYALAAAALLAERGHAVDVLCAEDRQPEVSAAVAVEAALAGKRLSFGARARIASAVRAARPDVVLVLGLKNVDAFELLLELAPLVRFVQDHTLFCPGLNKELADGELCTQPLGLACAERYVMRGGCLCFRREVFSGRPLAPLRALAGRLREIELARRARSLLVASRYMQGELVLAGLDPARVQCIPYFTDSASERARVSAPPPATRAFLELSSEPLILAPARLALPDKGVDYLLSALGELRAPFRAVIAGDGPARAWLEDKARSEGLAERVHFSGWLPAAALESLYPLARAVAFPSVWNEPFGLVGLEAMAHAKPVVAFRVGGVPEWLADGETGLLAERKDVRSFAEHLERLLASPTLGSQLGRKGRMRLEREFSRETHAADLERALSPAAR